MTDKELLWIWLGAVCQTGSAVSDALLERFEDNVEAIFSARREELETVPNISAPLLNALCRRDLEEAEAIRDYCRQNGIGILHPQSSAYPAALQRIKHRPLVLYYLGQLPDFDHRLCVAMVGTRHMTEYGKRTSYTIAYDLARANAIVVSGMALGIDGICHRAALDAGGSTAAILGCGLDRCYPKEHRALFDELIQANAVITEYKPGTPPNSYNFPQRNRIISGLSAATAVMEADERSGALITARCALYQGRNLYALPGKVGETNSRGTNSLIADGARIITKASDLLKDYVGNYPLLLPQEKTSAPLRRKPAYRKTVRDGDGNFYSVEVNKPSDAETQPPAERKSFSAPAFKTQDKAAVRTEDAARIRHPSLSSIESRVYSLLPEEGGITPDDMLSSGLTYAEIITALTTLEIKGLLCALPGGLYRRMSGKNG